MSAVMDETYLVKVESNVNSNKFYRATLMDDGSVVKRWGRVGSDGQVQTVHGGRSVYMSVVRQKESRGYTRVDVLAPSAAVPADAGRATLKRAAASLAADDDPVLTALIDRLVAANKHNLLEASGGLISVDVSGQVTTPLGIISMASITEARQLLVKMAALPRGRDLGQLTEQYLRLVPQKVATTLGAGWADYWLYDITTPTKQWDLIDALTSSVQYADNARKQAERAAADSVAVPSDLFRYKVRALSASSDEFKAVAARYDETKQAAHSWSNLRVKQVYALEDVRRAGEVRSTAERVRNVRRLWHGTVAANVLSILRGGLIIPPTRGGSINITGRMFGDGIYLSRSASKSLGYSVGYWSGSRQPEAFMFLTRTAMGHEYRPEGTSFDPGIPTKARGKSPDGKSYDSINVFAGKAGVRNPESIVWDADQVELAYLVEFAA